MAGSIFGEIFKISSFGESHGPAIGVVIDGCPAGVEFDESLIKTDLDRRKPGQSDISTSRKESEEFEVLSGVFEGKTLGTPIAIIVRNQDQRSGDYEHLKDIYRPSHADYTYQVKYEHRDYRGGGRQSARETVARVLAGAVAKMVLKNFGIHIQAAVSGVGAIVHSNYKDLDFVYSEKNKIRCAFSHLYDLMLEEIEKARKNGDSVGGIISCICSGVPVGLGEPVFDKLQAELAKAMMSINAVKGFEIGSGFEGCRENGSTQNDEFVSNSGQISTQSNHSGGIQGGLSNGQNIEFRVAFKPVASISKKQKTINMNAEPVDLEVQGRHDPCVVPRAVPIVEAMAAICLADFILRRASNRIQPLMRIF
ncbi:MAG: chorismate synthase [Bacteroidia bacterium]